MQCEFQSIKENSRQRNNKYQNNCQQVCLLIWQKPPLRSARLSCRQLDLE